jgi:hypothetical protein
LSLLERRGDARGGRATLAERTGGHVDTGGLQAVGVAGDVGVRAVHGHERLEREEPGLVERRVERRPRVALGKDKPVAAVPAGVLRVVYHLLAVEHGEHVRDRHRAAQVADAEAEQDRKHVAADLGREQLHVAQLLLLHGVLVFFAKGDGRERPPPR